MNLLIQMLSSSFLKKVFLPFFLQNKWSFHVWIVKFWKKGKESSWKGDLLLPQQRNSLNDFLDFIF